MKVMITTNLTRGVKYTYRTPTKFPELFRLQQASPASTRWFSCILLWVFHLSTTNNCLFSKYFIHRLLILRVGVPLLDSFLHIYFSALLTSLNKRKYQVGEADQVISHTPTLPSPSHYEQQLTPEMNENTPNQHVQRQLNTTVLSSSRFLTDHSFPKLIVLFFLFYFILFVFIVCLHAVKNI